jgi:hypothetical protein
MYHRYGRHGPHAWCRWRERHFHRHISAVGYVAREAIVHLRLPFVNAERIIFIVMEFDENGRESGRIVEVNNTNYLPEKKQDPFAMLEVYAEIDAEEKAKTDLKRQEDLTPDSELGEYADEIAFRYIRNQAIVAEAVALGKKSSEIREVYTKAFIAAYHSYVEARKMTVPDSTTWIIQQKARLDKTWDHDHRHIFLVGTDLLYQAVIRVHDYLRADPRETDYLQTISKYVSVYQHMYEIFDPVHAKEENRPNGSSRFLGNPNGYQY